MRKAVRLQLKYGADCIKLMATGGAGGRKSEGVLDRQMTYDEMRAASEAAHDQGKHVCAHIATSAAAMDAVRAGVVVVLGIYAASVAVGLVVLGVFQIGLAYAFFGFGIARVAALEASLIGMLEPVLNPVWVFAFLGERPGWWAVLGGLVIIAAVTVRTVAAERGRRPSPEPLIVHAEA